MTATLEQAVPVLAVDDVDLAIVYYREALGFAFGWKWGDPPTMASVCRDRVEVQLAKRGCAGSKGPACIYLFVNDIDEFYAECKRRGARILHEVADREYGMRDFDVEDPGGNNLCFGEPTVH